ncbi:MAG: alpha-galactosidase [Anaerolineales bacterium]|nr:alpha-galactosidase [Anaerolineales bacterium]
MMHRDRYTAESRFMQLSINPREGDWSLSISDGRTIVAEAVVSVTWRDGAGQSRTSTLKNVSISTAGSPELFSEGQHITLRPDPVDHAGLEISTETISPDEDPFCLIRTSIGNRSGEPVYLERFDAIGRADARRPSNRASREPGGAFAGSNPEHLRFFGQGWQSWSFAGVLKAGEKFPRSRLGPLSGPMQLCWGHDHPRADGRFISDFFGVLVDVQRWEGLLAGFLTQAQAFGRLELDLSRSPHILELWQNLEGVRLPHGESFLTDWACLYWTDLEQAEPLRPYLELAAATAGVKKRQDEVSGWCSWYCFGQDISAGRMKEQLGWMRENQRKLPLDLFQIDDGYQQNIGDWDQDRSRFPEPLSGIVREIHAASLTAGIWMAPLIALPGSQLMREHPDWLLKDHRRKSIKAGYGWGKFFRALDGTHPAVKEALRTWTTRAIAKWGFEYLKLDFLYAGAMLGKRYDDQKTGAMVLRDVLSLIRDTAGEQTFLVGCGCPLGSGIGLVDSMRISPDVSGSWRGRYKGVSLLVDRDPGFPSAWNAIRNTYYRAPLHGHWWLNDPDCLILREDGVELNEIEIRTLATMIALSGGVVINSDPLTSLSGERIDWLARITPPINRRPIQPTFFDPDLPPVVLHHMRGAVGEWTLAAVFNFDDSPRDMSLDCALLGFDADDAVFAFEGWDQIVKRFSGQSWPMGLTPPHGVKLWALRKVSDGAQWLGDSIHISQGSCVSGWNVEQGRVDGRIEARREGKAKIWLNVPGKIRAAALDGTLIDVEKVQDEVVCLGIQLCEQNDLRVEWD